ncbi:protein of unknown function [Candidatus Hydrogenisulfobacillus filiaventi]|uniref:Uncharacterized protein n=1 Tax=Candidatus Hydrogenisulfobacillus filiaventi TaxID=2707344 RepID=A0A6F8ZDF5_9FIRM|nr:protein of unknown function [Candidatus Hydrogenisulfobacillus filiaventi]
MRGTAGVIGRPPWPGPARQRRGPHPFAIAGTMEALLPGCSLPGTPRPPSGRPGLPRDVVAARLHNCPAAVRGTGA